jgi:toxin CptA
MAAASGLAAVALLLVDWSGWAIALLAGLLALNLWHCLRYYAWRSAPASCIGLLADSADIFLLQRDGMRIPCEILPDSLVTHYLAVLNLSVRGSRMARSIVLLPDAMDKEAFRRLRVWLKWELSARSVPGRREHGGHG